MIFRFLILYFHNTTGVVLLVMFHFKPVFGHDMKVFLSSASKIEPYVPFYFSLKRSHIVVWI